MTVGDVLNLALGIIVLLLGAIMKVIWGKVSDLEKEMSKKASAEDMQHLKDDISEVKQNVAVLVERTSTSDSMKSSLARFEAWLSRQESKT